MEITNPKNDETSVFINTVTVLKRLVGVVMNENVHIAFSPIRQLEVLFLPVLCMVIEMLFIAISPIEVVANSVQLGDAYHHNFEYFEKTLRIVNLIKMGEFAVRFVARRFVNVIH